MKFALKATIDHYTSLRAAGRLHGSIAEAVRKRRARSASRPPAPPSPGRIAELQRERNAMLAIPRCVELGEDLASHYLALVKAANPRLREWSLGARATRSIPPGIDGRLIYTKGSPGYVRRRSTFQRGVFIHCSAWVRPGRRIAVLTVESAIHEIPAPRGYHWDVDEDGLYLTGRAGAYHPTAGELLAGPKTVVRELKQHTAAQRAARKQLREAQTAILREQKQQARIIALAEAEGATVCLADSRRAGNCLAGSLSWARRHGFDPAQHYRPTEVLALANGDSHRVALVVAVAMRRHRIEMDRGYAVLAEHATPAH